MNILKKKEVIIDLSILIYLLNHFKQTPPPIGKEDGRLMILGFEFGIRSINGTNLKSIGKKIQKAAYQDIQMNIHIQII
ncbi:hypothetical protein ES703_51199 [subsurface metagenome]